MLTRRARWICLSAVVVVGGACGIDASQMSTGSFDATSTGAGGSAVSSSATFVGSGGSTASAGGSTVTTTASAAAGGGHASSSVVSGTGGAMSTSGPAGTGGGGGAGAGVGGAGGAGAGTGGAGACAPSDVGVCCEGDIDCGAQVCCLVTNGSGLTCAPACGGPLKPMPCDDSSDCPALMSCCGHSKHSASPTIDAIACKSACDAVPLDPTMTDGGYQLCDTALDDCPALLHCQPDPRVGGARHGLCM